MYDILTTAHVAGATVNPYRIVKTDSSGDIIQAAAASDLFEGVSSANLEKGKTYADGERIEVHRIGLVDIEAGGTISKGARLTSDTVGRAVTASAGDNTIGIAPCDAVVGDIMENVLINLNQEQKDTNLYTAEVTVSTAELLALNATPKPLVAAPGTGKAIVVEDVELFLDYAGTAYDGIASGEDLEVRYTDGSGQLVSTIETTGFLDATADAVRFSKPATTAAITPVANAAIVLRLASGEIATGTSPLKVRVTYKIIDMSW